MDNWKNISINVSFHITLRKKQSNILLFFIFLIIPYLLISYNMVGHSKFCLLLLGGSLIFHETLAINQVIGITLTLVGIILYAHVKVNTINL